MKYSIITINYNNRDGLEMTINSVLRQTFHDFEYIIIDGGSTDGSLEVIKKYASKIDYWISEPDKGIYNAMNKGIRKATGDYLNFMNSGDTFHTSSVLEDIAKMSLDDDIIIGGYYNNKINKPYIIPSQDVTLLTLLKYTINHQSTFYKNIVFNKRLYDENYIIMADAKLNFQAIIFDDCSVKIINYVVADYDLNGISSNYNIYKTEREKFLTELFPSRIIKDYTKMYTQGEVPLVSLLSELKESPTIQKWVFRFASILIKIKHYRT